MRCSSGACSWPAGRLADRVGHRRLFTIGLAAFGATSLLCGVAPSGAFLVGARAASGVAAALTVPPALALLVAGTDEQRRPRALGWWTAAGAGGGIAGLALGGVITDLAGWRAAFVAPAVLAFACLPFVTALDPGHAGDDRRPLDLRGTLAGVAGLVLLLAGLSAIGQGGAGIPAWAFLLAAAAALLAFARIEARAPFPLLARGFLADRRLAAGTLASAVNTAATGPLAVLGAVYLQDVRGWSPAATA
jgi:MFS family permease